MALSRLGFGLTILAVLINIQVSHSQNDPLNDFCRRFGHQTAIVDQKLYIDGGLLNWNPISQNPLNYTNTWLLYNDFNVDNNGMPQEYDNLTKGSNVPSVQGGVLWADPVNKLFHLYGGEYYQTSPDSFTLWTYDILYNTWNASSSNNIQIQRVSFGAGVADEANAIGYYYGGYLSNASVPAWGGVSMPTTNLVIYDMIKNSWTNNTGPDSTPRAEGVMIYLPVSDGGMLVYFGGLQFPYGPGNYTATGVPMSEIHLYDIANVKWYTQTATGNVPDMRRRFCAGAAWAEDRSSYNIYLYGGASMPPNTVGFDDVYILSLPSFTWIKWYPTTPGTSYPHHSLTCNVVNGTQMIVMGGTFPNSTDCDAPTAYGLHNLNLGKQNPQDAMWYQFLHNITGYNVPSEIIATIGGQASGGATVLAPATWGDRDLPTYFTRAYTAPSRTATRFIPATTTPSQPSSPTITHPSKPFPTGAVAGGAVGGAVLLICVGALIFFCYRRRNKKRVEPAEPAEPVGAERPSGVEGPLGVERPDKPYTIHETVPITPMAELATTNTFTPQPKYDAPYSPPHSTAMSPGADRRRGYSYTEQSPQGSPPPMHTSSPTQGYDMNFSHSQPPLNPEIPQPYYHNQSLPQHQPPNFYATDRVQQGYSPPPQQAWPTDNATYVASQPYYPPPRTFQEMPTMRSPPRANQQYQDPDFIYTGPISNEPISQESPQGRYQATRSYSGSQLMTPANPHAGSPHSVSPHPSEFNTTDSTHGGRTQ